MSLHDQLNAIRIKNGQEPLPNPGMIQGFGPNDPPPPMPENPDEDEFGLNDDPEPPKLPDSPLIPRQRSPRMVPPTSDDVLTVRNHTGRYQGIDATLTEDEQRNVGAIVLRAARREAEQKLKALVAQIPKRTYARKPTKRARTRSKGDA